MALLELRTITVAGSREAMGQAYGQACAGLVQAFVAQRARAATVYLRERGLRNQQLVTALAGQCLAALRRWDEPAWVEHQATAHGAGVDAVDLYAAANYTDLRDILAYPAQPSPAAAGAAVSPDAEGCTAMLFPGAGAQPLVAAQTWDLNPSDLEYVVALQRRPDHGPSTWSITCAGCPSLIGMNERGLSIGTTNIKIRPSRVGIPYLSLIHAALAASDRAQASARIISAPRAAAHTYWLADRTGGEDLECSADTVTRREARHGQPGLARTNHCLDGAHAQSEGEPPSSSSRARLVRAAAAVAGPQPTIAALKRLLADRSDGIDSINRYGEDGQGTSTNACVISVPARRELHVCRGPSDRGRWLTLGFSDAG